MRIGLVTPLPGHGRNPGCRLITEGIRWLLRGEDLVEIEMEAPWRPRDVDALVLCGNPRYDTGDHEWLYSGLIDAMQCGVPMFDLFAGACAVHGGTVEDDARLLLENPRNRAILSRLSAFRAITTRDARAQAVNRLAGLKSVQMPCSSWWAAKAMGVERKGGRDRIVVPIAGTDARVVRRLAAGRQVVAVAPKDLDWCEAKGLKATLENDPRALLERFAMAEEVIAYRLHAAIPAASLGCRVAMVAIDSRAQAVEAFGLPWAHFTEAIPAPALGVAPAEPDIRSLIRA